MPPNKICVLFGFLFLIFVFELTRKLKTLPTHLNWKINRYIPQIYINKYAIGKVIQINCLSLIFSKAKKNCIKYSDQISNNLST